MLRIQLLFSIIALSVRIELLCSSIRRLPPNRANGVAVFDSSLIRYNNACFHQRLLLCLLMEQYYNYVYQPNDEERERQRERERTNFMLIWPRILK